MGIEDAVESFPEGWRPKPDDKLVGRVIGLDEGESAYGVYPLVTVQRADGTEVAVHAFHTVLKRELARLQPKVGEKIAIKYFGRDTKGGYERYRVLVERPQQGGLDWSKHREAAEREMVPSSSEGPDLPEPPAEDDPWT